MSYIFHTELELFSFLVCAVLLFNTYQHHNKQFLANRLFIALLYVNMALLLLDILSWVLDGRAGTINAIFLMAVMMLGYLMATLPAFLWVIYANYQVFNDINRIRKLMGIFLIPLVANLIMTLITPFTGLLFYLDKNNVYHRGPCCSLYTALIFIYLIYAFILIISNRKNIEKRYFLPLVLFSLPPFVGSLIQAFLYGLSLIWSSVTISLLIAHLYIQNRKLNTDYLTGVYNRLQLDRYLQNKIRNSDTYNGFSAILLDINDFKKINDKYGHLIGDEALTVTTRLLKSSLRKDDFLARYGGDEFLIILDIQDMVTLEKTVTRIQENIRAFNKSSNKPYQLSLSMGYDVHDYKSGMSKDVFLKHLDDLMYKDKRAQS
ncbi:diguanylate cyclase domain-containing protein [Syntrophomonas curvata]